MTPAKSSKIALALPKGRMYDAVVNILSEAGIGIRTGSREYRPTISLPDFEVKILKPQNIIEMLDVGSRDLGFAGLDWTVELETELVELADTGLDPVRIVAAAPIELVENDGSLPKRRLLVASEYEKLTKNWIAKRGLDAQFVKTFGATEVFPPEDADLIVDNTATGQTLQANGLTIVDELMRSSTRLYASPQALDNPEKRSRIEDFVLLVNSVLEARKRVMVQMNVSAEQLEAVVEILPCMRSPTISPLFESTAGAISLAEPKAYAVKVAVPRTQLPQLIPQIKARGGTAIIVSKISQAIP